MSKPEDIPADVWKIASDEALKYVEWIDPPPVEGTASAEHVLAVSFSRVILAERKRCARVADQHGTNGGSDDCQGCGEEISAAILKGSE